MSNQALPVHDAELIAHDACESTSELPRHLLERQGASGMPVLAAQDRQLEI